MTNDLQDPWDAFYSSLGNMHDEVASLISESMEWGLNHLGKLVSMHHF
jgi:hypothetical protein